MLNRLYRLAALLLALGLMASAALPSAVQAQPAEARDAGLIMYVFMSETCPHCQAQKPFLQNLDAEHQALSIEFMEVMTTDEHHDLLRAMAAAHDVRPGSVPMVFLGGEVWVGDSEQIRSEISQTVERCLSNACADPRQMALAAAENADSEQAAALVRLPLIGEIDLAVQPLLVSTLMIAFVDGFNPCSIWILTILLALVLHSGSRGRVVLVGLTFLFTTAAIYGGFIAGVFSVLAYAAYLPWVYWIVALFALVFGVVNVKDYFWFKRGFSFTIDDKHKPGIFKGFRELMVNGKSPLALMGATIVMAGGIALIELPCTAGFPVIWSGLVNANEVGGIEFLGLLALYLFVYLSIELVIFLIAVIKLRIDRFQEGHGRVLKLIGGVIMIALAIVLLFAPELMSGIGSSMGVFLGAFAVTGLIVLLHRYVLPKVGVRIGDDW
ncbi:MAG: thioredoxin [Wenzhouxiangella sp.]|nr:thioredoxin [Wenzhouxiangella sp.]